MCGIGALLMVESWDNMMRALAKGVELMLRGSDDTAGQPHAHAIGGDAPASSKPEKTNALVIHNLAEPAPAEPQVHVFCPTCGELTIVRAMGPMTLEPSLVEITYCCVACGTETKVQLRKHARFSIGVSGALLCE